MAVVTNRRTEVGFYNFKKHLSPTTKFFFFFLSLVFMTFAKVCGFLRFWRRVRDPLYSDDYISVRCHWNVTTRSRDRFYCSRSWTSRDHQVLQSPCFQLCRKSAPNLLYFNKSVVLFIIIIMRFNFDSRYVSPILLVLFIIYIFLAPSYD
jgi:hypothetical protein